MKLSDFIKAPLRLFWDVTSQCNFQCKHCYMDGGDKLTDELTHEEAMALVDEFRDTGIFRLFIAGGEPLMREDIFDILKKVSEYEIPAVMNTNGYFIDEKTAQKLSQFDLSVVAVSLDGSTPQTHETFRGMKGSFKRALNALRFLKESGVNASAGCVLNRNNYLETPDIVNLCIECGATLLNIMRTAPVGRAASFEEFYLTFDMYTELIQQLERAYDEWKEDIALISNDPIVSTWLLLQQGVKKKEKKGRYCQAAGFSGYVQSNGDVLPCAYFPVLLGNVSTCSLRDIWKSSAAEKIRTLAGQLPPDCEECEYLVYCRGGCRGVCYTLYQRTDVRDPLCFKEFVGKMEITD
jgi:GeoRSP system SPASM domain protein